jgi:hypothetical protein
MHIHPSGLLAGLLHRAVAFQLFNQDPQRKQTCCFLLLLIMNVLW